MAQKLKRRIRLGNDMQTAKAYCSELVTPCGQGKDIVSTNAELAKRLQENGQLRFGFQVLDKHAPLGLPGPSAYTRVYGQALASPLRLTRLPSVQADAFRA